MTTEEKWELRLYIAGQTPKSVLALENITRYCKEYLKDRYSIEVIDLLKNPALAEGDQIFAIPTLVRKFPEPLRKNNRRSVERGTCTCRIKYQAFSSRSMKNTEGGNGVVEKIRLQLYVSGMSEKSMAAIENVKKFCNKFLKGRHKLEIIDIYKNPDVAEKMQIVFSPSLFKILPSPRKILIGNFSDTEKMKKALGINTSL